MFAVQYSCAGTIQVVAHNLDYRLCSSFCDKQFVLCSQLYNLFCILTWLMSVSIFFDHTFSVGAVALYVVASVLIALFPAVSKAWYTHASANHCIKDDQQHGGQPEIEFNPAYDGDNIHQVEILFEQKLPQSPRAKAELSPEGLSDMAVDAKILSKYTSVNHALQSDTLAPRQEAALKRVKQLFLREDAEPLHSEFISPRKPPASSKQAKDDEVTALASSRSPGNSSPTRPRSGTLQPKAAATSRSGSLKKLTRNSSQLAPNTTVDKIKRTRQARQKPSTPKTISTDANSAADRGLVSPRYSSRPIRGTKKKQLAIKTVDV